VALDEVPGAGCFLQADAIAGIGGDDIARPCFGTANAVLRGADQVQPVLAVAQRRRAIGADPDGIAAAVVAIRPAIRVHTGERVARADVPLPGGGAADGMAAGRVLEVDAERVGDCRVAGSVGAEVVAGDLVARSRRAADAHAVELVAGDDVALAFARAADGVIVPIADG